MQVESLSISATEKYEHYISCLRSFFTTERYRVHVAADVAQICLSILPSLLNKAPRYPISFSTGNES